MSEEWRTILTATKYEASSLGNVRRAVPYRSTKAGRLMSLYIDKHGYVRTSVSIDGVGIRSVLVHRLVLLAFKGLPPTPDHVGAHWNRIRSDNRPDNLRWATDQENMDDRARHETDPVGVRNPNVKLSEDDVNLIRWKYALGEASVSQLAWLHSVTDTNIRRIVRRRNWTHLEAFS